MIDRDWRGEDNYFMLKGGHVAAEAFETIMVVAERVVA
jgi:hypothetical protein